MSIRKIARVAGTSAATVSLALRDSPAISAATKRRIRAIAERIGYAANPAVSTLMSRFRGARRPGRRGVIALLFPATPLQQPARSRLLPRMLPVMQRRLEQFGFGLEQFAFGTGQLQEKRLHEVLRARGIEGIILMNSVPGIERLTFPIDHFASVAIGYSIAQPLHRVCAHQFSDTWRALEKLASAGYRRPGLVLYADLDRRTRFHFSSAIAGYLAFRGLKGAERAICRLDSARSRTAFLRWFADYRPDAIITEEDFLPLPLLQQHLASARIRTRELGYAVTDIIDPTKEYSGIRQNWDGIAQSAVEMVLAHLYRGARGVDAQPKLELVEGEWHDGKTTRH